MHVRKINVILICSFFSLVFKISLKTRSQRGVQLSECGPGVLRCNCEIPLGRCLQTHPVPSTSCIFVWNGFVCSEQGLTRCYFPRETVSLNVFSIWAVSVELQIGNILFLLLTLTLYFFSILIHKSLQELLGECCVELPAAFTQLVWKSYCWVGNISKL